MPLPLPPAVAGLTDCRVLGNKLKATLGTGSRVVLEDLCFEPVATPSTELERYAATLGQGLFPGNEPTDVAARQALTDRICLIHDDTMAYLLESATEVMARVRLDNDKKTVAKGALWYEEALPAESILVGLALASRVKRDGATYEAETLLEALEKTAVGLVQLGGKATVGRGLCRVLLPASQGGAA